MDFEESLRLSIALGLTIFLVLLRFDSERIMRSDYFRYRTPWMGPVSYYALVVAFTIGIVVILPEGRATLFLAPGDPDSLLPVMLLFSVVAVAAAVAFTFLRYRAILPLPVPLLPSRLLGAASSAVADELQFRSIVLGILIFADLPGGTGTALARPGAALRTRPAAPVEGARVVLPGRRGHPRLRRRAGDGHHRLGGAGHGRAFRGPGGPLHLCRWSAPHATDLSAPRCPTAAS